MPAATAINVPLALAGLQAFLGHALSMLPPCPHAVHFCVSTGAVLHIPGTDELLLGQSQPAENSMVVDGAEGLPAGASVPFRLTRNLQVRSPRAGLGATE